MQGWLLLWFYWIDLLIGFGAPLVLWACRRRGRLGMLDWRLFWMGAAIGAVWEVPIFVLSRHSSWPVIGWVRELPVHYCLFVVAHSLWDGGLFVVGVWLVRGLVSPPVLARFRPVELAVLIAFGQVSALLVEVSSILDDGWVYVEHYWWNPTLLRVADRPITLLPQLIWLVAPIAFYALALRISRRSPGGHG